jgi:integrase
VWTSAAGEYRRAPPVASVTECSICPTLAVGTDDQQGVGQRRVRALADEVAAGGRLSETSIQHTHRLLHAALEYAVGQGLIPRNPADGVRKPKRAKVEMKVWDAKQLARFMGATDGDRLFALWRLAAYTGMRRSELLGLRWEDIEFRHTHATLLLKQGQPVKVVLERLGHASPATMAV